MKCKTTIFGSNNPEIYFIEDVNHDNNVSLNGDLFTLILDSFGLNSNNCRFNSIVRDENCEDLSNEDIFINDIMNSNPKIIVTVGGSASDEIIGEEFKRITADHGKIFKTSIADALVIPVYHPTYVSKQENIVARTEFKNDIKKCIDLCTGAKTLKDYTKDEYDNDNVVCLTYEDFDKFCREEIDDAVDISYDIESNAKEKTSKDYRVVGFSLASREERSCYVVLESLDYIMSNRDKKLIESRLRHLLLKKKTFVYNCMHELPATLNWLSIEMPDVEDLFVMVKLMMGNAEKYEGNGGLKAQCSINLNTKDWSEDLDIYFDYLRDLNNNKKDNMKALLLKYYETFEIDHIMALVEEAYNDPSTFDSSVISYGKVPYKLIGRYGGTDSAILYPLRSFYQKKIENMNNELGIDLNIGYRYWMNHHYAGYTLERNGAHWNDKKATDIQVWCEEGMQESLKNLVKDPLSEPYIKDKLEWDFYSYLKDNYIESILGMNAKPKRITKNSVSIEVLIDSFKDTLRLMSIEPKVQKKKDGTTVVKNEYKLELGHIKTLAKSFLDSNPGLYDKWYTEYMKQFFSETRTVDEMKKLLNPTATAESFRVFVSNLLITDDIHYAKFYTDLIKITEEPNFDIGYYDRGDYMKDDKKLLELVLKLQSLEDMSKPNKLRVVNKFLSGNINLQSRKIKNALSTALSYNLESFNDYFILELYELYVLCGLDIEDKSTWTPQFNWLYNFRRYKKFSKMISTYIKGKVGRNSVWYVDKKSLENGDILTKRLIPYNKAIEDNVDVSNMDTVLQTDFKVDMADTGRWKATMHCLHPDTEIRLTDGRDIKVSELYKEFKSGKNNYVYSRSEIENKLIIELIRDVYISHQTKDMIRIYLDNDKYFEVTPDHKMVMRDGSYRKAEDLVVGDSLYPINIRIDETNHEKIFDPDLNEEIYCHYLSDNFNERYGLLRDMSNDHMGLNGSWVRHHRDFNPLNNNPDNVNRYGYNTHDEIHKSSEGRKKTWERIKYRMSNDPDYYNKIISHLRKNGYNTYRNNLEPHWKSNGHNHCTKYNNDPEYQLKCTKGRILKFLHNNNLYNSETYNNDIKNLSFKYKEDTIIKYFGSLSEAMRIAKEYNHNVTRIEYIHYDEPIDVYSVAVNSNSPSFSLSCGVMSKNTMPSGSTIKGIITSRYKGGVIFCPDCSQAEVRVLAAQSQDENLINAFMQDGMDIHKFVASLCFHHGDIEAVTSVERKIAKGAVFGILYGESEKAFADSFFHGDMNEALKVFDYFYTAFPKIKDYITESHEQFDKYHKVILPIMNRFLNMEALALENGNDTDKIYRQAQNFRIQGQTCLSGDTEIKMLDGTSKRIEDLANSNDKEFYVYSYDKDRDKIVPSKAILARRTKYESNLVRITLDNNEIIECTYDHRFLKRSGDYVEAQYLKIGDLLMSMYINNYKIRNIEYISYENPIPVYDITVPKYNNFVLSSGIVVHNCDLAGLILYNICKYIKDHNLKSKVFCFIHDSIEVDVPPEETFLMADMLKPLFNQYPWDNFKVPMASDIVVGASMGQESDIDILEHDEEYNEVTVKLKGFMNDIDELIEIWNEVYDVVEIVEREVTGTEYVPIGGLFQKKVVISKEMGTTKEKGSCKLHIIRKR